MAISLQSYNEILGKLARKIIADTPVNDLNPGSVLLTLLEAVASQDFENNASILSVLETLNIDALKNSDLDARAADYGLARKTSVKATGFIKIQDSSITKRATTLYAVKPAPIAGATKIYVNDASSWSSTGTLFIGRGTQQFEGPISYTSVVSNGSFYTINLASALQKDHLTSDTVIDAQGAIDRLIPSGTAVKIPSNNLSPEIRYITLRDAVLAAGEDTVSDISIIAENSGVQGNAGINSITMFDALPFATAIVSNTSVLSDGRDTESDDDLRERLKNYSATLSRGTRAAILAAVVGVSDSSDGKQVSSAVIQEPAAYGEPSIVYVDDGSGFQPSTQGQSVDVLLTSASGGEQFLQLSNYPLPRSQVKNEVSGPVELTAGSTLVVSVDGVEQEIIIYSTDYANVASATLVEIASAINTQANINNYNFRCRLSDESTRLLLYPTDSAAEFIQVLGTLSSGSVNANDAIKFSTNIYSYISLYKNNVLLKSKERVATLTTLSAPWTSLITDGTLVISVDGTPPQNQSFSTADFGGTPISAVSPLQWATAINSKFAGITATATSNGKIQISSNKTGSGSSIEIIGGTYVNDWFAGLPTYDVGTSSDFSINRQTGNVMLTAPATKGDSITAGNADAKGYVTSASTNTGTYDLSADGDGRPSEMVVVADGIAVEPRSDAMPAVGSGLKILTTDSSPGNSSIQTGCMRILADTTATLQNARVGDYIYIAYKQLSADWFSLNNTGLFKIVKKGKHTTSGVDTFVDVINVSASADPALDFHKTSLEQDVQTFGSDAYPQIWKASYVSTSVPITLQQMISSFGSDLANVKGSIFKTSSLKMTSTTENDGAIAVPVSIGKLSFIFDTAQGSELGNQSHVATRIASADMLTWFKRGSYIERVGDLISTNTLLKDRVRYADVTGGISANALDNAASLSSSLFNTSSLAYSDVVNITSGANKSLFKTPVEIQPSNILEIRDATPNASFDYLSGDSLQLVKSLTFSSDDSVIFILDNDAVNRTINVNFWRTGRVGSFIAPTNNQFSAYDADNESGVTFGSPTVWSTSSPINTNFDDYAVWFRSRNWYRTGGVSSSDGTLILRAKEYGPIGDSHRFVIDYPSYKNQSAKILHDNNSEYTTTTYYFGSDDAKATGFNSGSRFTVRNIKTITTTAQGSSTGQVSSGDYFYLYNSTNSVIVFWYAVNNDSTSQPTVSIPGVTVSRYWRIGSIVTGDSATNVAAKTAVAIDNDDSFVATSFQNVVSITNNFDISTPAPSQSGLGFVFNMSTNMCRYGFESTIDLSTVDIGDILSIASTLGSSISPGNYGTFKINAVSDVLKYVDVYNPNATQTTAGVVDVAQVSNIVAAGTNMTQTVTVTSGSSITTGGYFNIYDQAGLVVVWYDLTGSTPTPSVPGAIRYIKISGLTSSSSNSAVASATASAIDADSQFITTYSSGSSFTLTNSFIGPVIAASNGSGTSFTFATTNSGNPIGGKYFKLYDGITSTVAVWLNVNGDAIPPHGCDRAIQVILNSTDSANTVASKIAAYMNADSEFVAISSGSQVTISNYYNGARGTASDGVSPYATGFTVAVTQIGQNNSYNITSSSTGILIYPLLSTAVSDICDVINTSQTMTAAYVGNATDIIDTATKEELLAVSYAHNPDPLSGLSNFVKMFDGESFVKSFSNADPEFVLKKSLILQGLQPSIYDMSSCPNPGTTDVGEFFKLIPRTVDNVKHQLTHKAMSQLPIVADVDIAGDFRRIQIKSKKLGTAGAVEVVGGRANSAELSIIGSAGIDVNTDSNIEYLKLAVQAYPNVFSKGDTIKIYNDLPAKRKFLPDLNTTVQVQNDSLGNVKYFIGSRAFNFNPYTRWNITDVSSSYSAATGTIWRWAHTPSGAKAVVSGLVQSYNISSITRVYGAPYSTATVTLSSNHNLLAGQIVVISGIIDVPSLNGTWTVLSPGTNTFQFQCTGSNAVSVGGSLASVEAQSTHTQAYAADGTSLSTRIHAFDFFEGNSASPMSLSLTVDQVPTQADYFVITGPSFNSPGSTPTFAVWFDVDGAGTTPSNMAGKPYNLATYKTKVSVLSGDSVNTIVSKLSAALSSDVNLASFMVSSLTSGTSLANVQPGDIVNVWPKSGDTSLIANWPMGNQSQTSGALTVSGLPVLSVNPSSSYMDVINPNGRAMSNKFVSETGGMSISPAISTRFRLKHSALRRATTIVLNGTTATATTSIPHGFSIGDSVVISDTGTVDGTVTVTETPTSTSFKFLSSVSASTTNGNCTLSSSTTTRYKISSLGFKDLFRIQAALGDSPKFADCGVCVDDFVQISGSTFKADNRGRFRILSVDNDSIVIQNANGKEELDTYKLMNYTDITATWNSGSSTVSGTAGSFKNVSVGSWIRSIDDDDAAFVQVIAMNSLTPSLATSVTLGQTYRGATSTSVGLVADFENGVGLGTELLNIDDLQVYECDSALVGDSLVINSITDSTWFNKLNTGKRETTEWGSDATDRRQYVKVTNTSGLSQTSVSLAADLTGFYLLESSSALYETVRTVENASISRFNFDQRILYVTTSDRSYKMSSDYGTKIMSMGKIAFPTDTATGVDGYSYYTGLMRTVQRIIDGYEPDSETYPGRRAVGSNIESLPPLVKQISVALKISTKDGVNLNDITNDIKSTVISYISSLGVGQDVVLSEIVRRVKDITGVDAVTITKTTPDNNGERVSIYDNEKAITSPDLISLS